MLPASADVGGIGRLRSVRPPAPSTDSAGARTVGQAGSSDGARHPEPAEGPDDETLMRAYLAGERGAFEQLFRRYAERIYAVMLRHGMTPEDARDLVQQTFTRMHQARNDFRAGAKLRPWLWTIAYNLMRDSMRRRGTRNRGEQGLRALRTAADEASGGLDPEQRRALDTAMAALSDGQREVLVLHYYEGMSFAEIAKVMDIKEGAVRVRAHRGYRRLRELLGGEHGASHAV